MKIILLFLILYVTVCFAGPLHSKVRRPSSSRHDDHEPFHYVGPVEYKSEQPVPYKVPTEDFEYHPRPNKQLGTLAFYIRFLSCRWKLFN